MHRHRLHKLVCSLRSGLPNEVDFALHIASLLANDDQLNWSRDYPLVDAVCDSLRVFVCVCHDLKQKPKSDICYCYCKFWLKYFPSTDGPRYKIYQLCTLPPEILFKYMQFDQLTEFTDLLLHAKLYNRIKHAAELLRQISFAFGKVENGQKFTASSRLLKFISLLLFSEDVHYKDIALDILANISPKLSKVAIRTNDTDDQFLVDSIHEYCMNSVMQDNAYIHVVNRCLEIISKILKTSHRQVYQSIASALSERRFIQRLEQLVTCQHDVPLFLAAMECCHRISEYQPSLIEGDKKHLIKLLINYLNFDAREHFTLAAFARIKLIDEPDTTDYLFEDDVEHDEDECEINGNGNLHHARPIIQNGIPHNGQILIRVQPHVTMVTQKTNHSQIQPQIQTQSQPQTQPQSDASSLPQLKTQPQVTPQTQTQTQTQVTPQLPVHIQIHPRPPIISTAQIQARPQITIVQQQQQPVRAEVKVLTQAAVTPPSPQHAYVCEWNNCKQSFIGPKQVYSHVFEEHINPLPADSTSNCLWSGPDGFGPGCKTKRPKYSLLTHLNDFHCNPTVLNQCALRAQQLAATGSTVIQPPIKPPEHPGYAPDAAFTAIMRHATLGLDFNGIYTDIPRPSDKELHSSLSVSVRLTAALTLRNLAAASREIKQSLVRYESLLSEICMTQGRDESKTIAECLGISFNTLSSRPSNGMSHAETTNLQAKVQTVIDSQHPVDAMEVDHM